MTRIQNSMNISTVKCLFPPFLDEMFTSIAHNNLDCKWSHPGHCAYNDLMVKCLLCVPHKIVADAWRSMIALHFCLILLSCLFLIFTSFCGLANLITNGS